TGYLEQIHFKTLVENELRETLDRLILCFVNALDSKSPWTKGHSLRVQHYCLMIARELKLPEEQVEQLSIAALLHDIGKIGTYDDILNKLEDLTPDEYAMIKKHPGNAVSILEPIPQFSTLLPIIRAHHERLDGRGYPDGLQDTQIPLPARILCVADAYDAITSERPYKESMGKARGIAEVQRSSGSQFDPAVVRALAEAHQKPGFIPEP
ncbi:MAG TPA: HD-GYP domain-containing protein, partial [Geopsychrobacteraceae bacterium]